MYEQAGGGISYGCCARAARTDTHSGSVKSDICRSHVNEGVKDEDRSE